MFKKYLFIVLMFLAVLLQALEATSKADSQKNKKSSKAKK